jgi:hypothetical protein
MYTRLLQGWGKGSSGALCTLVFVIEAEGCSYQNLVAALNSWLLILK